MSRMQASIEAVIEFNEASDRIRNGYVYREHYPMRTVLIDGKEMLRKRQPWDTANGYFQREAYALIGETFRKKGGKQLIQKCARDSDYLPKRSAFSDNPFLWGLLAVDPDACCLGKEAKEAPRFARLFSHADRNRVPPIYLIGFLKQIGSYRTLDSEFRSPTLDPSLKLEAGKTAL